MATLEKFLKAHTYNKSKHPFITHTRIGIPEIIGSGGSYYIPPADLPKFYELYCKKLKKGEPEYLTEKQSRDSGLLYIDLDFKYESLGRHHTEDLVDDCVGNILESAKKYIEFDETQFGCFVMEREQPYFNGKHNKDGLHILFTLNVDRRIQAKIREDFLREFDFSTLPLINEPEDVYDDGIVKGSTNLQLTGSQKPNCAPYEVVYGVNIVYDPADGEFCFKDKNTGIFPITAPFLQATTAYENNSLIHFPPTREGATLLNVEPPPVRVVGEYSQKDMELNYRFAERAFQEGLLFKQANSPGMPWRGVGLKIKSIFGDTEDAYRLYDKFNLLSTKLYDAVENRRIWDSFSINPDYNSFALLSADFKVCNPVVFKQIQQEMKDAERAEYRAEMEKKRLEKLAKQVEKETKKEAEQLRNEELINRSILVSSDNEAIDYMVEKLGDRFIFTKGQMYFKDGNKWIIDDKLIQTILLKEILESNICKVIKENYMPFCENVSSAKNVREGLLVKLTILKRDDNAYDKFHSSTRNKLCFKDGVLDIASKTFVKWSQVPSNTIFTTVIIERQFYDYFHKPDRKMIDTVKNTIFEPLFGEKLNEALWFFSRAVGANIQDKNFMSYTGNRNCGKGIIEKLFKASLQSYISSYSLDNLLCIRESNKSSDIAKENAWLIPFQFSRLAISQETEDNVNETVSKKMKISNKAMKSIMSGGDTITARGLYKDPIQFTIDSALVIMGNNNITMSGEDSNEHHLMLQSVSQFVSQEKINQKRAEHGDEFVSSWKLRDETLVDKVLTDGYTNALVYLLYENFKTEPVPISNRAEDGAEYCSVREKIFKVFTITKNDKDRVSKDELFSLIKADQKKIVAELRELGCVGDCNCKTTIEYIDDKGVEKKKQVQAFKRLTLKPLVEDVN